MLKSIDILGERISFYYQDKQSIKTSFGGTISLILTLLFALLIIGFGQDFFARTNPNMLGSTEAYDIAPMFTVNNKNFSLALRIEDMNASPVVQPELFEIVGKYLHYNLINGEFIPIAEHMINITNCTQDHFYDGSTFAKETRVGMVCPEMKDLILGGNWDQNEIGQLEFKLKVCKQGEKSSRNLPCGTDLQREEYMSQGLFFSFYYQKTLLNPNNYHNGLGKTILTDYYTVSNNLYKNRNYYFKETLLKTDYGWLIEDIEETHSYGFDYNIVHYEYFNNLSDGSFLDALSTIGVYFTREKEHYKRVYPKAQTLAAQVGGILQIFLQIGILIVSHYNLNHTQLRFSDFLVKNMKPDSNLSFKLVKGGIINKNNEDAKIMNPMQQKISLTTNMINNLSVNQESEQNMSHFKNDSKLLFPQNNVSKLIVKDSNAFSDQKIENQQDSNYNSNNIQNEIQGKLLLSADNNNARPIKNRPVNIKLSENQASTSDLDPDKEVSLSTLYFLFKYYYNLVEAVS